MPKIPQKSENNGKNLAIYELALLLLFLLVVGLVHLCRKRQQNRIRKLEDEQLGKFSLYMQRMSSDGSWLLPSGFVNFYMVYWLLLWYLGILQISYNNRPTMRTLNINLHRYSIWVLVFEFWLSGLWILSLIFTSPDTEYMEQTNFWMFITLGVWCACIVVW